MNGSELFEKLSKMSDDERKTCQFWQLTDKGYFNQCVEIVKDVVLMEADATEEKFDEVVNAMGADEIATVARCAQTVEGEMEDTYWNGFDDTYRQILKESIERKLGKVVD